MKVFYINPYRKSKERIESIRLRQVRYARYENRQVADDEKEYTMEEALARIKRIVTKQEESINP